MANPQPFDPDAFLAQTAPAPLQGGFDPDAFLDDRLDGMMGVAQDAVGAAVDTFTSPYTFAQKMAEDPRKTYEAAGPWLPAAGAALGTAIAPGVGTAAGAGAGEMLRQATGIAFDDPNIPREPWPAAREAMLQTGLAGLPEVSGVFKAAPGARPYLERGIAAAGRQIEPIVEGGKNMIARGTEVMTGVPARQTRALIDKPGNLIRGMFQGKKLGKAVEEAEDEVTGRLLSESDPSTFSDDVATEFRKYFGREPSPQELSRFADEVTPKGFRLTPEIDAAITTNKGGQADDIVTNLLVKIKKDPGAINTAEAMAGIKAIDRTFPNYTAKNAKIVQKYSELRNSLAEIVATNEPKLATAKKAAHEGMVGGAFRHPFRQTKTGQTSAVPFLSFLLSPSNWGGEELAKQALKLPLFSPAVYGTAIAAGSTAVEGAKFAATNPTARQALISRWIVGREGNKK